MMFYQNFSFRLISRLLVINIIALIIYHLSQTTQMWVTIAGLITVLLLLIIELYRYINQVREDLRRFTTSLKQRDSTLNFKNKATRSSFPELYASFSEILTTQKDMELEKDGLFELIRTIVEQIPVGLIVLSHHPTGEFRKTEIAIFNKAAGAMLNTPAYKYWHRLSDHVPEFAEEISELWNGGRRFIELTIAEKFTQMSIELIPIHLYQGNYSIISFQDIKDEIEQKESEAWNRLIGVISHEILNSITPISSLSDTIHSMIKDKAQLGTEALSDLRPAVQAIQRRSSGLLDFVKDYRLIAELPSPQLQEHTIGEILQHIKILMQPLTLEKNVNLNVIQTAARLTLHIDLKLIEQALINLVTNSIYAVEGIKNPSISISYRMEKQKLYLEVEDNGKGLNKEMREKIFVPFFSTKKEGSGIGLTITRNIMKMHQGNVEVHSIPFEKTTFSLVFNMTS